MKQPRSTATRAPASHRPNARPSKALGQHFLEEPEIVQAIIAAGDLSQADMVVEIGPGRGVLTRELVKRSGQVVAVELDAWLASSLSGRLGYPENLTVICADARTCDFQEALPAEGPWKVIANLPYYAANPIVRRLLEEERRPSLMVVTVQQEVAQSMMAVPGRMSLLSVAVQCYGQPRLVCKVPPSSFRPPPKVNSAVVRIDVRPSPALPTEDAAGFFSLVKAAFSAPRKQLHNALSHGLGIPAEEATRLLESVGLEPTRRPGTLTLEEWGRLYHGRTGA